MHKRHFALSIALGAVFAPALSLAPVASAAPGQAACTAQLQIGKKYHLTTYRAGAIHMAGYVQFTAKHFGKWHKVRVVTDHPKTKRWFWGYFDQHRVTFKKKSPAERWTAWMKYCKGALIEGQVFKGGKAPALTFTLDTSRVRP